MRFVIVTGMSGGGKSTALRMLEDVGFYCVDNLPVPLIEKFVELIAMPNSEVGKVALGLDVRADQPFEDAQKVLEKLKENGYSFEILFMEASDQVLLKRYKETRRMHPLSPDGRVEDGILKERKILQDIRSKADYVIDTSKLLTRELKEEIDRIFVKNEEYNSLMITILSFGFKHGIPADADLVFDVRFLPNPFYIDELKYKTGNDKEVQDYVMSFPEAETFIDKLCDMLSFLIPNYVKEGKYQLVIGIGCTGGKHRSVTLANRLYSRLKNKGNYGLKIAHRDVGQGV
ncbi:MAG: RNase adapter RapZ [Lachnospiraceae bacterium]|nr:RNase adapter RapZ [Lachnospiraceae bacterium]MCI7191302.1 RNase adapter RapZ [Lachnospiraceae bacterium]MDD7628967.1 RNase adapter RapZ [Lachnospiraceae bacterium]MDY4117641.1 RNase adapter RapZ [Lachnospiraceae bacterium]